MILLVRRIHGDDQAMGGDRLPTWPGPGLLDILPGLKAGDSYCATHEQAPA